MHATESNSFMLPADLEKGLQSVKGTDVKLNSAQYVIVNCGCTVYSVVRSGGNYSDFLNWGFTALGFWEYKMSNTWT